MPSFGALLKQIRAREGLTQLELANELGINRNTLLAWENSRPPKKRDWVIQLGKILALKDDELNELLFAAGHRLEPQTTPPQATVVQYQAAKIGDAEIQSLKVTQHLELASGVLSPLPRRRADCYHHILLPENYIERADILEAVRTQVLATTPSVVPTSAIKEKPAALHGMGGIGKTVIARALCDNLAVQEAFPDGILWATLGHMPNLIDQLRIWTETLGGRANENAPTVESLKCLLAMLLKERTCLLILDDVWQLTHINAFRVDAPHCRLLLTTRDAEIARELGAQVQSIPVMMPEDAIQLLDEWAYGHLAKTDPELKAQIVKRLGYLPLAVKLAGAQFQWIAPADWLRTFDVKDLESLRPEDLLHSSLRKTFLLSLDALDTISYNKYARQLYLALAIFREDEGFPLEAIAKLWKGLAGLNTNSTSKLLHDLAARALLNLAPHDSSQSAHLHDLMRDLIGEELGEEEHLAAHRVLLDTYHATCTSNGWHTAPDDGYLYDHLAYHLDAAGAWEELKRLFVDQRWMEVRVPQRDYTYDGYLTDLSLAWDHAVENAKEQIEADQKLSSFAECLRYTLICSSINSLVGNYVPGVIAQAVKERLWSQKRAMSVTVKILDAEHRALVYIELLESGQLKPRYQEEAQQHGLKAARTIRDKWRQTYVLAALALQLSEPNRTRVLQEALKAAQNIQDEWYHAPALRDLAPKLTGDLLEQALEATLSIRREGDQAEVLEALVPQLTGELLDRALEATLAIHDEEKRAEVLEAMAPQLTGALLERALEAAPAIQNAVFRAEVLEALAEQLPEPRRTQILQEVLETAQFHEERTRVKVWLAMPERFPKPNHTQTLQEALETAQTIQGEGTWARTLAALAPHLTGAPLKRTLKAARAIQNKRYRAQALGFLAPQLTEPARTQVLQEALEAARAIVDEGERYMALAALIPQLMGTFLEQAMDATLAIRYEGFRAELLEAMAPQLRGTLLERALEAARAANLNYILWKLLSLWSTQLTGTLLERALEAARTIKNEGYRADALGFLVPQLTEPARTQVLQEALEAARAIVDEESRADTLGFLAPQLTEPTSAQVLQEALKAAKAIRNERYRAETLGSLASLLTEPTHTKVLQKALKIAQTIQDTGKQAEVLVALAPLLTEPTRTKVLQKALKIAQTIQDTGEQAEVLVALAPLLTGALFEQALITASGIQNIGMRARALGAFLPAIVDQLWLLKIIRRALLDAFSPAHQLDRQTALSSIRKDLFRPPVLSPETFNELVLQVIEICQGWRWM